MTQRCPSRCLRRSRLNYHPRVWTSVQFANPACHPVCSWVAENEPPLALPLTAVPAHALAPKAVRHHLCSWPHHRIAIPDAGALVCSAVPSLIQNPVCGLSRTVLFSVVTSILPSCTQLSFLVLSCLLHQMRAYPHGGIPLSWRG